MYKITLTSPTGEKSYFKTKWPGDVTLGQLSWCTLRGILAIKNMAITEVWTKSNQTISSFMGYKFEQKRIDGRLKKYKLLPYYTTMIYLK